MDYDKINIIAQWGKIGLFSHAHGTLCYSEEIKICKYLLLTKNITSTWIAHPNAKGEKNSYV